MERDVINMDQSSLRAIIEEQTRRALWEVKNVTDCVDDELWNRLYCGMPLWKHIYHMLHSLDLWYINPNSTTYQEPSIHVKDLNNLDVVSEKVLNRKEIAEYYEAIQKKIMNYIQTLSEEELLEYPENCKYTRFTLILSQFRHLHSHMGMIMGFIIDDTGKWPAVLGLTRPIPEDEHYEKFF